MRTSPVALTMLLLAVQLQASSFAQESRQPAFTLHSRVTTNTKEGFKRELKEVRYVSSSGSFRIVQTDERSGVYSEKVFEQGRGLFNVHHTLEVLWRNSAVAPETASTPPLTAEQLRASPNFVKTEEVLGRTTYVYRIKNEQTGAPEADYYFTPELGRVPLKIVEYAKGSVFRITEPVGITFGEPDASQLKAPDYEVIETMPISGGVLNGKATRKPEPEYPSIARSARASGTVVVQILVNEDGTVRRANAVGGHPLLRQAAVEAARKARFSPTLLAGQPVKVAGVVTYNFLLQ